MTKAPTTNVVIPREIEALAAITVVNLLDLPLRSEIDPNSMLLEHGLRQVLQIPKT